MEATLAMKMAEGVKVNTLNNSFQDGFVGRFNEIIDSTPPRHSYRQRNENTTKELQQKISTLKLERDNTKIFLQIERKEQTEENFLAVLAALTTTSTSDHSHAASFTPH